MLIGLPDIKILIKSFSNVKKFKYGTKQQWRKEKVVNVHAHTAAQFY